MITYIFRFLPVASPSDLSSDFRFSPAKMAGLGDLVRARVSTPVGPGTAKSAGMGVRLRPRRRGCGLANVGGTMGAP